MNKSRVLFLIFIVFLLGSIFVNYQTYKSLSFQNILRSDSSRIMTFDSVNKSIPSIPNIGYQTLPMAAHKAFYAINEGKLAVADTLIMEADRVNPYNYVGDGLKGYLFYKLGYLETASYHAKIAFYNWPKATLNYTTYNDILVSLKDTTEIIAAFNFLPTYLKEDREYYNYFRKSLANARFSYLKTIYKDKSDVSANTLIGNWIRAYNFEGSKSVLDTTYQYKFTNTEMINPSNNSFSYKIEKDSIVILFKTNQKKVAAYGLQYSKLDSTLILSGVPLEGGKTQTQFFKKVE